MIEIDLINKTSKKVDEQMVKKSIEIELKRNKVNGVYVSVAVVGGGEMEKLVDKYYQKDKEEHPVLSFPNRDMEGEFIEEQELENLGEIVLNYNYAKRESENFDRSIDELLADWAAHGVLHLLGKHHE